MRVLKKEWNVSFVSKNLWSASTVGSAASCSVSSFIWTDFRFRFVVALVWFGHLVVSQFGPATLNCLLLLLKCWSARFILTSSWYLRLVVSTLLLTSSCAQASSSSHRLYFWLRVGTCGSSYRPFWFRPAHRQADRRIDFTFGFGLLMYMQLVA